MKDDIKLERIKVNDSGNLLVFPKSAEDKTKLLNKKDFFPHLEKKDLKDNNKKYTVLLKGATANTIADGESEVESLGIVEVEPIRNSDGIQVKDAKFILIQKKG